MVEDRRKGMASGGRHVALGQGAYEGYVEIGAIWHVFPFGFRDPDAPEALGFSLSTRSWRLVLHVFSGRVPRR
jgi:hypothetical protein